MQILVAGVGNLLRGDDGFGVEVARALMCRSLPPGVRVVETGIGLQYISDAQLSLYWAGKPEVPQKQYAIQEKVADRLVYDASYGLYSDTQSKKQAQLTKTMTDLESQIAQGKKPVSDWAAGVQTWKSSGGDKIRTELEQALSATAGK